MVRSMESLEMTETKGFVPLVEGTNAMTKTETTTFLGRDKVGSEERPFCYRRRGCGEGGNRCRSRKSNRAQ